VTSSHNTSFPPAVLQVLLIVVLVFSLARYFVDGFALEMMGRSLSQGGDFKAYYLAGAMLRAGEDVYDLERSYEVAQHLFSAEVVGSAKYPYLYPPPLAIAMIPLSHLPFRWAYRLWVLGEQVFLIASLYLLAENLPSFGGYAWPFLIILAANMYPVYLSNDIGQVGMLILLVLSLAIHFARRGRFFWAGVVLGVGGMIKISPLLLLGFFALQRKWRALTGAILALVVLSAVSIGVAGPQVMFSFIQTNLGKSVPEQIGFYSNLSLAAFIHRLFSVPGGSPYELPVRWGFILTCLGLLVLLSHRQYPQTGQTFTVLFSLWITAMLLVSPITWEHHLVWLLPAFGFAVSALVDTQSRSSPWLFLWFALIYTVVAFENLPLNRFGQWQFQSGWWIFSGDYLRTNFVADLRLFAVAGFFVLLIVILRSMRMRPEGDTFASGEAFP